MRLVQGAALAAIAMIALSACAGATTPSTAPSAPAGPGSVAPSVPPPRDPGPAIDTDALVAAAADRDGQAVLVNGFFLAADDRAQLCSMVLESYPPQCGGGTVGLTGEVPGDVLAALDTTTEPGIATATWGWVEVTGTFRAAGVDGAPTIEISSIRRVEP